MGYKPQGTVYNLIFEGDQYEGLVIKMRGMTIGRLAMLIQQGWDSKNPSKNLEVFDFIASKIIEWNVEHPEIETPTTSIDDKGVVTVIDAACCGVCGLMEGAPLPKLGQTFMCLDMVFITKIMMTWMQAVASVAVPKEMNSQIGDRIEQALAAMQTETMPTPSL